MLVSRNFSGKCLLDIILVPHYCECTIHISKPTSIDAVYVNMLNVGILLFACQLCCYIQILKYQGRVKCVLNISMSVTGFEDDSGFTQNLTHPMSVSIILLLMSSSAKMVERAL